MLAGSCCNSRHVYRIVGQYRSVTRGVRNTAGTMAPIKEGDAVPNVDLFDGSPDKKVNAATLFAKGKHVIFGIPGAFTPTCQNEHFPTFLQDYDKLEAKGVKSVTCISVNDPFVMEAFGKAIGAGDKVKCLADTCGEFTKAIDLTLDATQALGNIRSQRYAMVIEDGKVAALNLEKSPGEVTCSKAAGVLGVLEKMK